MVQGSTSSCIDCWSWFGCLQGMMPLLYNQCRYLWEGRNILHQSGRLIHPSPWHGGYLPISLPPLIFIWPWLPWLSSVSGSIPLLVHYLPASTGYRHHPSALHTCPFQGLQPNHFTCGLHLSSVDALVDILGPSHNFLFFHPREALLVGCQWPPCHLSLVASSYHHLLWR